MEKSQIHRLIVKIVDMYYGIDSYGILAVLSKDYDYDYVKDPNFEQYLAEACKLHGIVKHDNKYYIPKTYMIPVRMDCGVEISSCRICQFNTHASQLPEHLRELLGYSLSSEFRVCTLDTNLKIMSTMKGTPRNCPRNLAYKQIHEIETEKENPLETQDLTPVELLTQHNIENVVRGLITGF